MNREQQQGNPQRFLFLQNTLSLDTQLCYYAIYTCNQIRSQQIQHQLYFEFSVKALESIRLQSDNNKKLVLLTLGDLIVSVKVVKNPEQYIFEEGLYRNYLVAELIFTSLELPPLQIGRKQLRLEDWTTLVVTIEKKIHFTDKIEWILEDCIPVLQLGSTEPPKLFSCKIKGLSLATVKLSKHKAPSQPQMRSKILHDGPLDTIPKTQIPDIETLSKYQSPETKNGRLFLCHDMEGGYKQDMNRHFPFPQEKNKYKAHTQYSHTYRCLHLAQAQIFNYFSHYLITIPPKHWRRLCKMNSTKCLGTYIIEGNSISQQQYLSDYTIKLLVYFCRKYKFDGYLINFEYAIKNVSGLLIPWLNKLTQQIHKAVPNSKIIWYDSVITNGKVSYQNELNQHNEVFYKVTDGIFLNYWWDEDKIGNSMKRAINGKIIYVGNDCFGRGTYGGGKYNTFKAINKIRQIDNSTNTIAPALFAIGYTYQQDKSNLQAWKINEKCMYRGMSYSKIEISHDNWEYFNQNSNGFTWEIGNQWAVTSFQNCQRMYRRKIFNLLGKEGSNGNLIINFFTTVAGTGPKFQDSYKVTLKVSLGDIILNQSTTQWKQASEVEKIIELKLNIDQDLITQETLLIIIEEGHDCEKWAGYYGSRFKNDRLYITKYNKENDWGARIKTNFPNGVNLPYITYYNMGHGINFYMMGQKLKKSYNFLSDCDQIFPYVMNPPIHTSLYYQDAFMGGTCLLVEDATKLKLIELSLKSQESQQNLTKMRQISCRFAIKNLFSNQTFKLLVKVGTQTKAINQKEQRALKNNWYYYIYHFQLTSPQASEKIILYLESSSENSSYLIGQTAIYEEKHQSQDLKFQIQSFEIVLSEHNPPVAPLFFDAYIKMKQPGRFLFKFGEQFACFGWADELNENRAIIKNIHGTFHSKNNKVKILAINQSLLFTEIYQREINTKILGGNSKLTLI